MARRNMYDRLIHKSKITEEIRPINGSNTDYIDKHGNVYKDYGNNLFYPKKNCVNKVNGYVYCGITYDDGNKQRRVHRLVVEAFIPNPQNLPVVLHIDNDKTNCEIYNLKWGTVSENTKQAFDDGLAKNDKGWEDSQSLAVVVFDMKQNYIGEYGSVKECSKATGITPTGILYQCKHNVRSKPRCGYYFRFYNEYKEKGFVL